MCLTFEPLPGQGYIWMAHKTPGSDAWELALRSHELWVMLADSLREQGLDPLELLGWKNTGTPKIVSFSLSSSLMYVALLLNSFCLASVFFIYLFHRLSS